MNSKVTDTGDVVLQDGETLMSDADAAEFFREDAQKAKEEFLLSEELRGCPNIVRMDECKILPHEGRSGGEIVIRTETVTPFSTILEREALTKGDILRLGADLCSALEACREHGIIHRNIKPEHIYRGEDGRYKLGDFSIACRVEDKDSTSTRAGTANYMAPEVYHERPYDTSADLYSLGMVLYRLLNNNRFPFLPEGFAKVTRADREKALERRMAGEELPKPANDKGELAAIVLKACAPKPEERYATPEEMRTELQALLSNAAPQPPANEKPVQQAVPEPKKEPERKEEPEPKEELKPADVPQKAETPKPVDPPKPQIPPKQEAAAKPAAENWQPVKEKQASDPKPVSNNGQIAKKPADAQQKEEKKKASKRGLIITIAVVAILAAAAGVFFFLKMREGSSSSETVPAPAAEQAAAEDAAGSEPAAEADAQEATAEATPETTAATPEPEQEPAAEPEKTPEENYQAALALMESGDYPQAEEAFEALGDYAESAEKLAEVRYRIARAYETGSGGTRDDSLAYNYYHLASENGHADAMNKLGEFAYYGIAREQDYEEAFRLFQQAEELGSTDANYYLGLCFENGHGVAANEKTARAYYMIAAEEGNAEAQKKIEG